MKPDSKVNSTDDTKIHPAEISRNYSGDSVFFTPFPILFFVRTAPSITKSLFSFFSLYSSFGKKKKKTIKKEEKGNSPRA